MNHELILMVGLAIIGVAFAIAARFRFTTIVLEGYAGARLYSSWAIS